MKVITGPQDHDLRFWMVSIPSKGTDRTEKHAAIKAAGFNLYRQGSGIKARIAAIGLAARIEKATGIEMQVSKHDYL